jgi:hypothetical protein
MIKYIVLSAAIVVIVITIKDRKVEPRQFECKTVKDVGACDRSACRVRFTDESLGEADKPMTGMEMCKVEDHWVYTDRESAEALSNR